MKRGILVPKKKGVGQGMWETISPIAHQASAGATSSPPRRSRDEE
jgi:hypothetical protein